MFGYFPFLVKKHVDLNLLLNSRTERYLEERLTTAEEIFDLGKQLLTKAGTVIASGGKKFCYNHSIFLVEISTDVYKNDINLVRIYLQRDDRRKQIFLGYRPDGREGCQTTHELPENKVNLEMLRDLLGYYYLTAQETELNKGLQETRKKEECYTIIPQ